MVKTSSSFHTSRDLIRAVDARSFGVQMEHLEVDFSVPYQEQACQIIGHAAVWQETGQALQKKEIARFTISQRRALLLYLTDPGGHWQIERNCTHCRERLDVELPLPEIIDYQVRAEQEKDLPFEWKGRTMTFRRATGSDQHYWRLEGDRDLDQAARQIMQALQLAGPPLDQMDAQGISALEEAFAEFDPLAAFVANVDCPDCGKESAFSIELEAMACHKMQKKTTRLLDEVHLLASHYHWSEAEIFRLPLARRRNYLQRILKDYQSS